MNYFLSIIDGNYDNFPITSYKNDIKVGYEHKQESLKRYLNDLGFENIRLSKQFEINENPNDNFFYFITDIENFDIDESVADWNDTLIKRECIEYIKNNQNCYLIFLHENINIQNNLLSKIEMLSKAYQIPRKKIVSLVQNEFTFDIIFNLLYNKNHNTLNIVYENWSEDQNTYLPNLSNNNYGYRYRAQVGLFRFYGLFNDIRAVHIDEVEKHTNLNFYYFINGDQIDQHFKKQNKIPLSEKVHDIFVKNKNFKIIILNEHEYETESFIIYVNELVKKQGYDASRVYLMTNNSKLEEYKRKHNLDINVYSLDFLVMFIATHMIEFGEPEFIENKTGNFFMCHNRGPKPHRYGLLCMLKKNNLLNEIDWSLILGWYRKEQREFNTDKIFYDSVFDYADFRYYRKEIYFFGDIDIKKSKFEEEKTWFDGRKNEHIEWKHVYEYQTYQTSYVNIVTESCYIDKEIHITEKSMKPFYFFQFPIFLSSYNHVKYLKERFGFDVFDDIIDHSYDDEPDNRLRLKKFFKEIERLNNIKDELILFYKKNKDRFYKNKEIVVKIKNSSRDFDYFKNLIL